MINLFNKEFVYRIVSVIVYVPIAILPLFYSYYISVIVYLIFTSIIIYEITEMKNRVKITYLFNAYLLTASLSFFLFLFLLITEKFSVYELFIFIFIIWLFDTFSYIGGKIIGGAKLMPKISSGKTISGLIIGISLTVITTKLILNFFDNSVQYSISFILFVIALSFFGDILVSLLKRSANVKDSGVVMPGHGGLLDRFDSFILVFFIIALSNL